MPQDPIIFGGTVRSNLDPFATASGPAEDAALWAALEAADEGGVTAAVLLGDVPARLTATRLAAGVLAAAPLAAAAVAGLAACAAWAT